MPRFRIPRVAAPGPGPVQFAASVDDSKDLTASSRLAQRQGSQGLGNNDQNNNIDSSGSTTNPDEGSGVNSSAIVRPIPVRMIPVGIRQISDSMYMPVLTQPFPDNRGRRNSSRRILLSLPIPTTHPLPKCQTEIPPQTSSEDMVQMGRDASPLQPKIFPDRRRRRRRLLQPTSHARGSGQPRGLATRGCSPAKCSSPPGQSKWPSRTRRRGTKHFRPVCHDASRLSS